MVFKATLFKGDVQASSLILIFILTYLMSIHLHWKVQLFFVITQVEKLLIGQKLQKLQNCACKV